MFSLDRFYNILHSNLISQFKNGKSVYFFPFGTYQERNFLSEHIDQVSPDIPTYTPRWRSEKSWVHCYFFDQEPIYEQTFDVIKKSMLQPARFDGQNRIDILAISEKSDLVQNFSKTNGYYNWYYFFHGFAALDWYRDFQYLESTSFNHFDKVFISYNHLISKYRAYRLHLVSSMLEQNLIDYGHVSLPLADSTGTWKQTIANPETPLDSRARLKVYQNLKSLKAPLIIDTDRPVGSMSAKVNIDQLTSALFHVVTETIYFQDKLHLTEKIFKPIVARRPFFLVAAPGNLAYLKSYGFQTFDQWIDESYDQEPDHYIRIEKIVEELKRLCALSPDELKKMHKEMQSILDYNFNHFYTNFKYQIVDELVDNFEHILCRINNGRQPNNHSRYHQRFELSPEYLLEVKKRLKQ